MAYMQEVLHIHDQDILNAVYYHTVGHAGMSPLERVIFIADFTSADRDYPGVERMREKALRSSYLSLAEPAKTFISKRRRWFLRVQERELFPFGDSPLFSATVVECRTSAGTYRLNLIRMS